MMLVYDPESRLRHGCAELFTDDEGWIVIVCDCGENLGQYPDNVTAVDGLIDHVINESTGGELE